MVLFFLLPEYWIIEYRTVKFYKLSDYRILDQSVDLPDYRISTHQKLSVAHLCVLNTNKMSAEYCNDIRTQLNIT
jgi:hypothetical protein